MFTDGRYWGEKYYKLYSEHIPFSKLAEITRSNQKIFQRWVSHPTYDEFWQKLTPSAEQYAKMDIPILTITGHFDGDQHGAMYYYFGHMANASDEAKAKEILAQLQSGGDFAQLARQHSLDPSTQESGGDLGFFPRGTLVVPEVEDAAFALSVGQISSVISSPMGYHIVQVVERVQDKPLTEEAWQALKEATFRRWVSELWQQATIEVLVQL